MLAGKYRLERVLKRGGMGAVWVATHTSLETEVAVKFMLMPAAAADGTSAEAVTDAALALQRFEREAKAAAKIRSTNVVQILDHGIDRGVPYIVMELLRGEDLRTRLKGARKLSLEETARILTPVARALQLAHNEGLVHRDIKPENIFLSKEGDDIVPKVLDFGVAKARGVGAHLSGDDDDHATVSGAAIGTPFYMSPEQATSKAVDHRSDLWALGVLAYRMLTGRTPFNGDTMFKVMMDICHSPFPSATSVNPDLPAAVDGFFETALAREPEHRFQSAKQMAKALTALAPRSASSRPPPREAGLSYGEIGTPSGGTRPVALSNPNDTGRTPQGAVIPAPVAAAPEGPPTVASAVLRTPGPLADRRVWVGAGVGAAALLTLVVVLATGGGDAPTAPVAAASTSPVPPAPPTIAAESPKTAAPVATATSPDASASVRAGSSASASAAPSSSAPKLKGKLIYAPTDI